MSLGAVVAEAERFVKSVGLPALAECDVLAVLRANQSDMLRFLLALGLEAGVSPAQALQRTAAIYFNIAALQVADDLADGDCTYLDPALGAGTAAQFMLQNLFYLSALQASISPQVLEAVSSELVRGAAPQSLDIRNDHWDLGQAKAAAEGFGGAHHSAYCQILWQGSKFEAGARAHGWALGIGISVASDLRSNDKRFYTLSSEERRTLVEWTVTSIAPLRNLGLRSLARAVERIQAELSQTIAQEPPRSPPHSNGTTRA